MAKRFIYTNAPTIVSAISFVLTSVTYTTPGTYYIDVNSTGTTTISITASGGYGCTETIGCVPIGYGAGGGGGGAFSQTVRNSVLGQLKIVLGDYYEDTSKVYSGGTDVICYAAKGANAMGGSGAAGGAASSCIGDTKYSGGKGGDSSGASGAGGGGGESASINGNGNNGSNAVGTTGGAGGTGTTGGDGGRGGDNGTSNATNGSLPGGGGGGGGTNRGLGSKGSITISYYKQV